MGERSNGQSIYDVFEKGYRRKVIDTNGGGTLGVSFPGDVREDHDVDLGDDVVFYESEKPGIIELHFE